MGYYFHVAETVKSKVKNTELVPIVPGQYLICTDTGDIYYDTADSKRKQLTDIIDLDTDAERTAILAPLDKTYFVKGTGHFWRYLGNKWVDLSGYITSDALNSHTGDNSNPHKVTASQVGLGNVPNVATNDQTPTYTAASTLTELVSGEKLSTAFGKISKAIKDLISHIGNTTVHITSDERKTWDNAVPSTRKVNDKPLSTDIKLTASDVGAAATSHGNHVPDKQTADNATFLRNDNTWQKVTPANIGAAATSHGTHVTYSDTAPVMDGTATVGSNAAVARSDHRHPTDTSRAAASDLTSHKNDTASHVTSGEKTTWNGKQDNITGGASTITSSNLTASRALVSNASGKVAVSDTTLAELGHVHGVTSPIQTQLNTKIDNAIGTNGITATVSGTKLTVNSPADLSLMDRTTRRLFPYGTSIGTDKDLNTIEYLKVGNFYCSANATAKTLSNCPTADAFMMEVFSPLSETFDDETTKTYRYRVRILTTYRGKQYLQYVSSGATAGTFTYGAWQQYIMANDLTTKADTSSYVAATLSSSKWTSNKQAVAVSGMAASTNGYVALAPNATEAQKAAAALAGLSVDTQGTNSLTISATTVPTVDIPIVVTMIG